MRRKGIILFVLGLLVLCVAGAAAQEITAQNPIIWADVPDPSIIRVGDTYYMTSTTMHMNPGVPIMKSTNLVDWEIVNYVYDILGSSDAQTLSNGKDEYGRGSWASSLAYKDGIFYVAFSSQTEGKTFIFSTEDIENGPWEKSVLNFTHDMSLLFDDDGRVYLVHGGGDIRLLELNEDATAIKAGGLNQVIIPNASAIASPNVILAAEGAHVRKINGKYYVFLITWPAGGMRTQLCFRSDNITGPYEGRVVLRDAGIAQGGIIDTPDGEWYALLFGDRGAVGRIPYLVPVTWEDDWPVFGVNGKVPVDTGIPLNFTSMVVASDEFNQRSERVGAYHTVVPVRVTTEQAEPMEGLGKEILINGGFENDLTAWTSYNGAEIVLSQDEVYSGENSLYISNRTTPDAGAMQDLTGKLLPGKSYTFSAKVRYDAESAPGVKGFAIYFQAGENQSVKIVGSGVVGKGQWGELKGTYRIPDSAVLTEPRIYIGSSWTPRPDPDRDLMDFWVDDVSVLDASVPELIINGGFENGLSEWSVHDQADLSISKDVSYSGSSSVYVANRSGTGAGPQQYLTGKMMPGRTYRVSAKVRYDTAAAPNTRDFNICFQDGDWQTIKIMGSGTITKGQWGTVEGVFTVPEDLELNEPLIFIETSWTAEQDPNRDLFDFYVDDISVLDITPQEKIVYGENDYNGSNLSLVWQWNHNPDNRFWSLTDRPGYLRLINGQVSTSILDARNTLTQRTFGPECSAVIAMDISNMKHGDYAGLAAFQQNYGFVGVKMEGRTKSIIMVNAGSGTPIEVESIPITQNRVYLKVECDFRNQRDIAYFYYSLDGYRWHQIGNTLRMSYTMPHFMGYRFALFNYATVDTGGYVDFDYFRVGDKMTGTNESAVVLKAGLGAVPKVTGAPNVEVVVPVLMEALPKGNYRSLAASFTIPDLLTVENVEFNMENITGECSWEYADNQLKLEVSGENIAFSNNSSDLFANLILKVARFVPGDQSVVVSTDFINVDGGKVVYNVNQAQAKVEVEALETGALVKIPGYSNPLRDYKLGADPYALVYEGRVYVYMSSDEYTYDNTGKLIENNFSSLNKVFVMSSDDMVNWTDHGAIPVAGARNINQGRGIAKWAGGSWAPAAAHKKINGQDKFFLYFSNSAGGIGVLEADTPIGPWRDPLGRALITHSTPGVAGVVWLFDPAVLVDDDGKAYLYFGGGIPGGNNQTQEDWANPRTARVIQLGDDMISTVGEAKVIDAPYMFESSGIHKYNGKYYYSYCTNFGPRPQGEDVPAAGEIAYMISDNPMGPFTYVGNVLKNPHHFFGVGGNNHHAIFEFEDQWYIVYHAQTVAKAQLGDGLGYRSPHINKVEYYDNGLMKDIIGDRYGISQLKPLNPYQRVEAETIAWQKGITTEECSAPGGYVASINLNVTNIDDGDWLAVANADFGADGPSIFSANVAASVGGQIEIRIDSPEGRVIGTLDIESTGGDQEWKLLQCDVENVTGVHNIFFMFKGTNEAKTNLFKFDYWQFK